MWVMAWLREALQRSIRAWHHFVKSSPSINELPWMYWRSAGGRLQTLGTDANTAHGLLRFDRARLPRVAARYLPC